MMSADDPARDAAFDVDPERALARLCAAGVAEPSTLVMCFAPRGPDEPHPAPPWLGFNSRVDRPSGPGRLVRLERGVLSDCVAYVVDPDAARWPDDRDVSDDRTPDDRLALGIRLAVERVRRLGPPVRRFAATGPADVLAVPGRLSTIADVLGDRISLRPCQDPVEAGGRILDALDRGDHGHYSDSRAVQVLAGHRRPGLVRRDLDRARVWERRWPSLTRGLFDEDVGGDTGSPPSE